VQPADTVPSVSRLKDVVISASRVPEGADQVSATVTVVSAEDIDRRGAASLEEALEGEVGISVRALPVRVQTAFSGTGRGGNEGINIRGLEGDQINLMVDGVGLPSAYSFGSVQSGRGDYLDPEGYKQIEIVRGAASTQYGSSGLAGSVMFVTKEPEDYLGNGRSEQFRLKAGYASANRSTHLAPTFAFEAGDIKGLVLASMRMGHETETEGENASSNSTRTAANPQDFRSGYLLAKIKQKVSADHGLKLTVESLRRSSETESLSTRSSTIADDDSTDTTSRNLVKVDWRHTPQGSWYDALDVSIYSQGSQSDQLGVQTRPASNPKVRTRDAAYNEQTTGLSAQWEKNWGSSTLHRWVFGADFKRSAYDMVVLRTGDFSTPVKYFPDTEGESSGAFVQDEITWGSVKLTPGLRYDQYKFTPKRVNTGYVATYETLSDQALSPRLGISWDVRPDLRAYGAYSRGFRAPKAGQINGSFSNGTSYAYVGNRTLQSERSDSLEFGLRGQTATSRYSAAVFRGEYKDFIQEAVNTGSCAIESVTYTSCYQAQNLNRATITGLELRGEFALSRHWRAQLAYAHVEGRSVSGTTEDHLASVDPDKLVGSLQFSPASHWGLGARMTAVDRKNMAPSTAAVIPGGYTVFDLTGWYQPTKSTQLSVGLYNLFDKKYTRWADVRDLASSAASTVDAYTQPGRNFTINLVHSF
jgi:hemoglobin/transferrin/lactoferrin receptor protein